MSTCVSRSPPPAATIMSVRASRFGVALDAGAVEREPGRIDADPLPRLHLALVAFLRDLLVEIDRHRADARRRARNARRVGAADRRARPCQCASRPSPRHETMPIAGDPDLARVSHWRAPPSGNAMSAATFSMLARKLGLGKFDQAERELGVADRLAVAPDLGLGDREAGAVVHHLAPKPRAPGRASRRCAALPPSRAARTACG